MTYAEILKLQDYQGILPYYNQAVAQLPRWLQTAKRIRDKRDSFIAQSKEELNAFLNKHDYFCDSDKSKNSVGGMIFRNGTKESYINYSLNTGHLSINTEFANAEDLKLVIALTKTNLDFKKSFKLYRKYGTGDSRVLSYYALLIQKLGHQIKRDLKDIHRAVSMCQEYIPSSTGMEIEYEESSKKFYIRLKDGGWGMSHKSEENFMDYFTDTDVKKQLVRHYNILKYKAITNPKNYRCVPII